MDAMSSMNTSNSGDNCNNTTAAGKGSREACNSCMLAKVGKSTTARVLVSAWKAAPEGTLATEGTPASEGIPATVGRQWQQGCSQ